MRAAGGELLYYPKRETEAQARARGVQFASPEGCLPGAATEPSALACDLADSIAASSLGEDAELGELCRQHLLTWETLEPEEWGALRDRICDLPARTLAGLRAKAALVVGFDDDGENDPELMLNLAKNLLALG